MKLKQLTLVLENCEMITIKGSDVGNLFVDDTTMRIQGKFAGGQIIRHSIAGRFYVELHKRANVNYHIHGLEHGTMKVFERLTTWPDITSIELIMQSGDESNDETLEYTLLWDSRRSDQNSYQTSYVSTEGNLYIVVSDKEKVGDVFDKDWIDAPGYTHSLSKLIKEE